jgi:hypothetical protein
MGGRPKSPPPLFKSRPRNDAGIANRRPERYPSSGSFAAKLLIIVAFFEGCRNPNSGGGLASGYWKTSPSGRERRGIKMAVISVVTMFAIEAVLGPLAQAEARGRGRGNAAAAQAEGWVPLFNGRDLAGWYTFLQKHGKNQDPDKVITIEDGSIHLYKHAPEGSSVVMGYIGTEKEYGDYHLRLQYRWGAKKFEPRLALKRDAGLYYHLTGPDAVWPRSLQFQIEQTNVGDLIALYGMQLDTWIEPMSREAAMPVFLDAQSGGRPHVLGGRGIAFLKRLPGDHEVEGWNTVEVIARGSSTTHILNGRVVAQGQNIRFADPDRPGQAPQPVIRGRIALEIEAAELFFRNVELRDLREGTGGAL